MDKFYIHKAKGYLKILKENKDGIWVSESPQFKGKIMIGKKKIEIKLYPAFKPGGPQGVIPKNPNKFIIETGD
tara:strand:- start:829 stop:1047 length:219 start_codon:yes stop_codon:yes gene_type:complete